MSTRIADIQTTDSENYSFILQQNVSVPLGNGGVIRCNVYKPKAQVETAKFPVLITYGPYGKDVPYRE